MVFSEGESSQMKSCAITTTSINLSSFDPKSVEVEYIRLKPANFESKVEPAKRICGKLYENRKISS